MIKRAAAILLILSVAAQATPALAGETASAAYYEEFNSVMGIQENSETEVLTLDTAIEKALKNNTNLKMTNAELELNEDERDDLYNDFIYKGTDGFSELLSIIKYDINRANSLMNYEQQKASVENSMKSAYVTLLNAERSLALEEMALKNDEAELVISRKKATLGMISSQELSESELSYLKSKAALSEKEKSLEEAYASFNVLIGENSDKRYKLVLEEDFTPLQMDTSIDSYITRKLTSSTNIKQKENNLELAEKQLDMFYANGSASYASLENSVTNASLSLKDAKEALKNSIRSCYNEIMTLESNYSNNLSQLEILKTKYETTKKKYELNMATELEVKQAQYEVANMQSTIIGQIYEHMLLAEQFENVDLL